MKNLYLAAFVFFCTFSFSQNETRKLISISLGSTYGIAFGNNFLNKAYRNNVGYEFDFRINITKKIFIGSQFRETNYEIKDKTLIGDFDRAIGSSNYIYAGFSHQFLNKKFYLEHRFGVGEQKIKHESSLSNYATFGKSYLFGTKLVYFLKPEISFYGGLDFTYSNYPTDTGGSYESFYSNSFQITPSLGLKFSFWNIKTNKKTKIIPIQ